MRRSTALVMFASLLLVGCSSSLPTEQSEAPATGAPTGSAPTGAAPGDTASAAASEPAAAPDPELEAFRGALHAQTPLDPDALVAAVVGAGFDRSAIERTRELDSLGAPVTFLEIAVRVADGCLVGQVGDGEPMALRTEQLGGERCLVGDVIALD